MDGSTGGDFDYAMKPLKIISWPVGTWPLQEHDVFSRMRASLAAAIMMVTLALLQAEVYLDSSDAENNLDALLIYSCGVLALAKVISFHVWPRGLVSNFASAVRDYVETNGAEKRRIMRRHARMGRVALGSMLFFSSFSATFFAIVSIFVEKEEEEANATTDNIPNYPIPCERILAALNVPGNLYLFIFAVEYGLLMVIGVGNLGSDSLFVGITFHLCGQAEVLSTELSKLRDENRKSRERFVSLTKRHLYLIDLAEMLNDTINTILIIQLFSSCLLICTSGFQLILALNVGNVTVVLKSIVVVSTLLIQLFVYSYVGDYMKRQMESIGSAAYSCGWYDLPRHIEKDIVLVIMRTQRPVYLSAGKFFLLNLETYTSIVKTSMSYLSVLRVMVNA